MSYQQKCELVAYTQQVSQGKFKPEVHGNVGVLDLDLVGKDRKLAWQRLGDMSKEAAMTTFINTLNNLCPSFHPYVEAQKKDIEMKAQRHAEEEENRRREEERKKLEEEEELKRKQELEEQEEKRRQIKEALNSQTYEQFKAYAEQQYPNNPDQQAILIRQLQEQHYIQYMQQIFQQQILSQNSTPEKKEVSSELPLDVEAAALEALANVQNFPVDADQYSEGSGNDPEGNNILNSLCFGKFTNLGRNRIPRDRSCFHVDKKGHPGLQGIHTQRRKRFYHQSRPRRNGHSACSYTWRWFLLILGICYWFVSGAPGCWCLLTFESVIVILIDVMHDRYDIGFGLFFEWSKSPTEQVSVHISDSEEEDEEDEHDNG